MNGKLNYSIFLKNIPNFVGLVLVAALGFIIGGYIGFSYKGEYNFRNDNALSIAESLQEKANADINLYVEILSALKKEEYIVIEELLHSSVRIWVQSSNIDSVRNTSLISESVVKKALGYQNKYCSDECLGICINLNSSSKCN